MQQDDNDKQNGNGENSPPQNDGDELDAAFENLDNVSGAKENPKNNKQPELSARADAAKKKEQGSNKESAPLIKGAQHFDQEADILAKNFHISPNEPLPDLDSLNAKAFNAVDTKNPGRQVYALICRNSLPARMSALEKLEDFSHKNFLKPLAHGIIPISSTGECHYVMVIERPPSMTLQKMLDKDNKPDERFILREIITPIIQILENLQNAAVIHGKINLSNIYYNEQGSPKIMLGECFSEPCGMAQNDYFEPPDRAITTPIGRGDEDYSADYFALGVVVAQLIFGLNTVQKLDKNDYFEKCMAQGIFNTIVGNRELPSMMDDLLKGLLADERQNRWGQTQLNLWLGGKRFNLLRPTPPKEASRPYLFSDKPHFNRRHLAHNLYNGWNQAKIELRDKRVGRWLELSCKNPDLADKIGKIVQMTGGDISRLATDDDDLVSKSITLLNPYGPFRLPKFSSFVTGFGPSLAEAISSNNIYAINCIMRIINNQSVEPWVETHAALSGFNSSHFAWLIETRSRLYQSKSPGFGTDRVLYDLNPTMPCLSQLVAKHHVISAGQLLLSLDSMSSDRHKLSDPFDRHILAFIYSRLGIMQEARTPLDRFPKFSKNNALRALTLFATAQRKSGNIPLQGLSRWFNERLKPAIESVHSRSLKLEMKEELERAVPKGNLTSMLKVFSSPDSISQDEDGFQKARIRYARNAGKIAELNQNGTTDERSNEIGMRIAVALAMGAFFMTMVRITQQHFFSF